MFTAKHLPKKQPTQLYTPGQGWLAMAQINPSPGHLQRNAQKIWQHIQQAEALGLDLVVFPELCLMGYPIGDVISRHPFLVTEQLKWLNVLARKTGQTRALVGFVEPNPTGFGKPFYNSLAVLGEGQIETILRKSLLPTYGEFYEARTFEPAPTSQNNLYSLHGRHYVLTVCEDLWADAAFFERPLYAHDPLAKAFASCAPEKPDAILNMSASPGRAQKEPVRQALLSHLATRYNTSLVYVNQVGAVDELSFSGGSRVLSADGQVLTEARSFAEDFVVVNPFTSETAAENTPEAIRKQTAGAAGLPQSQAPVPEIPEPKIPEFDAFNTHELPWLYQTLCQGIRDYFAKTGFSRAVLGLSGGLDSSVVAVLLADALGPGNVLGVSMPSLLTPADAREDAQTLAQNLGMGFTEIPITETTTAALSGLQQVAPALASLWGPAAETSYAADNVQAITRAMLLRLLGNNYRALPIATSDKSELYLGYATVNGDMSGALGPIADVPKTTVRLLARWLNENRQTKNTSQNALPERIITKPSGADLAVDPKTGKLLTAEDALMPYLFADEVIWRLEVLHQSPSQLAAETFQWETLETALSDEQKQTLKAQWLQTFFTRMSRAVFKWWVAPPAILVSGSGSATGGITKTEYRQPVTACRIDWTERSADWMAEQLEG